MGSYSHFLATDESIVQNKQFNNNINSIIFSVQASLKLMLSVDLNSKQYPAAMIL